MREWVVTDGAYALDGGTIWLRLADPEGREHNVSLVQHRLPQRVGGPLRGRLYWEDRLVAIGSSQEAEIVAVLRQAAVKAAGAPGLGGTAVDRVAPKGNRLVLGADIEAYLDATDDSPEAALSHMVREVLAFVGSEAYVALSAGKV